MRERGHALADAGEVDLIGNDATPLVDCAQLAEGDKFEEEGVKAKEFDR